MSSEIPGSRGYVEWRPRPALERYAACTWAGGLDPVGPAPAEPVLPDGCMDVIWAGGGLFVAGPDTGPHPSTGPGRPAVGVRFRPGIGTLFLGVPANDLRDQRIDLGEFWPGADRLGQALTDASSRRRAAAVLEREVACRLPGIPEPDPVVEAAARSWSRGPGRCDTAWLADRAGVSERQLHRRFLAAVGCGPKRLQRILRFQGFLAMCGQPEAGLAEMAARSGYADQAHLTREARTMSGLTPARLRAARRDVRNIQDRAAGARLQERHD